MNYPNANALAAARTLDLAIQEMVIAKKLIEGTNRALWDSQIQEIIDQAIERAQAAAAAIRQGNI